MPRPFIEFIQQQVLPWQQGLYGGARSEVSVRMLSLDEETGASSLLLYYPPGWARDEAEHLTADEELFVLDGELVIAGRRYPQYAYAHLPAGYVRDSQAAPDGATVLCFFSAEPRAVSGAPAGGSCDERRLVEYVHALDGEWGGNFHPQFPPGAGRKFLRRDPLDGEETWLLGTMPLRNGRRPEKHPVVEEMYLLAGELVGHVGLMRPGAYFWRPPEEWHGPFGSLTGNLMLFRTKGGPLSTEYTEHEVAFSWTPAHQPVLPDHLAGYGALPWTGCACS